MRRFLEEERMEGQKESVLPSVRKKRMGKRKHLEKRERRSCLVRC